MDTPRIRLTVADYLAMPDDGKRYELHDGVLVEQKYVLPNGTEMPSAIFLHNWIISILHHTLMQIVFKQRSGYVLGDNQDYILADDIVLRPDVSFIAGQFETLPQYPTQAPDIAVEVLSPSNTASEMTYKITTYLRYGSRLVWVVDPEKRTVTVYRPAEESQILSRTLTIDDTLTGEDVLPEFRLSVREVFGG